MTIPFILRRITLGFSVLTCMSMAACTAQTAQTEIRAEDTSIEQTSLQTTGTSTERLQLPIPTVEVITQLPNFGEGVVFDREGRLFVSSPFTNSVLLINETGEPQVWSEVENPNGHKVLADGTHVVMERAESGGQVTFISPDGDVLRRISQDEQGQPLQEPNDIAVDLVNDGFYFTAPGPFQGNTPGRIHYVDAEGSVCTVSDGEVDFPNGIVLRPDGRTLLVAESLQNRVLKFEVEAPCELSGPEVFAVLPSHPNRWTNGEAEPDGIALDESGNLYVAHFGAGLIRVFNPSGDLLGSLDTNASSITNLGFNSTNLSELFVYAANGNSLEEIEQGGRIIRITLPETQGLLLFPPE